jgi:hypothetical protein
MQGNKVSLPLRDIHLPDTLSWWPPAPGYWLILAVLVLIVFAVFLLRIRHRKQQLKRSIQSEVDRIEQAFRDSRDNAQLVKSLSILLRRVSLACFPDSGCESLTGRHWLTFLDKQLQDSDEFLHGVGQVLETAPYRPHVDIDAEALLVLCHRWVINACKSHSGRST